MAEGAAIIGEAPVLADGSWRAEVPPFIPFHLQAVDEFELAIRNQTLWIQGMPGEDRVCGGCHEERTAANSPTAQQQALATTQYSTFMAPILARTEYPWFMQGAAATTGGYTGASELQKILTDKCSNCHNATTNGGQAQEYYTVTSTPEGGGAPITARIARLDLSSTPVTVVYDMRAATYPMSYVSIFYPSAMQMGMDMTEVVGTVPPMWGVPSDARRSRLIEKINITSANDANLTAWPLGQPFNDPNVRGASRTMHPEDQNVTLTRAERTALIRAFDMGGQYYARSNAATYAATTAAP
jgi:hypothetical protein